MKRWEFWPQATWVGVCAAIILAAWAPTLGRGEPFRWLDANHNGTATIVAGLMQAIATAGAIVATVWQTRITFREARSQDEARRRTEQIGHTEKAAALVWNACHVLERYAAVISHGTAALRTQAAEGRADIAAIRGGFDRFEFERLSPTPMREFIQAAGIVARASEEVEAMWETVDTLPLAHEHILSEYQFVRTTYSDRLRSFARDLHNRHEMIAQSLHSN